MRPLAAFAAAAALLLGAAPASAAGMQRDGYRYERALDADAGGPVVFEPDGALFAHAAPGFSDLRVADARGEELPWRPLPRLAGQRPRFIPREAVASTREKSGSRTLVTLDLGWRNLPVDEVRIRAADRRYERTIAIRGSNDGERFTPLVRGKIFRFGGTRSEPLALGARHRYLRIAVENGDDAPLREIEVRARARSRAILVEGGHPRPYAVLYGNRGVLAPAYDFARVPATALALERAKGELGVERANPAFERPSDTRSFVARNPGLKAAALAIAALALSAAGLLALRSRVRRDSGDESAVPQRSQ
jgi:hypothetical protein